MTASPREYNRERLYRAMDEQGLDAVVASSPQNVMYMCGRGIISPLLTFVVTTRDGRQGIVINEADAYFARSDLAIDDIREFRYSDTTAAATEKAIDAAIGMIADYGLARSQIGIEDDSLTAVNRDRLVEGLPYAVLKNGGPVLSEARIYKTAEEIELLRRAAYFTDKAISVGFSLSRPGDTEKDVAVALQSSILRFGAMQLRTGRTTCSAGVQSTIVHAHPLEKPILPGEIIHVDFGGTFDGYQTDIARNAVVGDPSPKQRDIYQRLWEINQAIVAFVRPGVIVRDIFRVSEEAFAKAGLTYPWGTLGHSTGLQTHEGFELSATSARVIEPSMVINIEPSHIEQGDARYDIEDTYLVTDSGLERLSDYSDPSEMYVIR